jgi:hypothetical protein
MSVEMDVMEDKEAVGNAGNEHETVSSEYETEDENYDDTETYTDDRNGEQS